MIITSRKSWDRDVCWEGWRLLEYFFGFPVNCKNRTIFYAWYLKHAWYFGKKIASHHLKLCKKLFQNFNVVVTSTFLFQSQSIKIVDLRLKRKARIIPLKAIYTEIGIDRE